MRYTDSSGRVLLHALDGTGTSLHAKDRVCSRGEELKS